MLHFRLYPLEGMWKNPGSATRGPLSITRAHGLEVLTVEDQTIFLQMLHNMLEAIPQLKVAATARSKAEAMAACE